MSAHSHHRSETLPNVFRVIRQPKCTVVGGFAAVVHLHGAPQTDSAPLAQAAEAMPKTEPLKTSRVKHMRQRHELLQQDKGLKFEPFYIAAVHRDAMSLARELRLDRKR
jgi:hypothetical protein